MDKAASVVELDGDWRLRGWETSGRETSGGSRFPGSPQPAPGEPLAATMAVVVSLMEATAQLQRQIAEVLRDVAARCGNEAAIQRPGPATNDLSAPLDPVERRPLLAGRRHPGSPVEPLTAREEAVLRWLVTRLSLREIGREMSVSINTVKSHTRAIYRKLGVSNRQQAVQRGRQLAILPARRGAAAYLQSA